MAPKFPNPDPPTDKVRDRLDQFIEVAGRAVYPPLAVAPSPTTAGQIWWDISDTVKIRDEANAAWASLATTMGAVSFSEAQTLTSGEKTQALTNIGAQPAGAYQPSGGYLRYDQAQTLTDTQQRQVIANIGQRIPYVVTASRTFETAYLNDTGGPLIAAALGASANNITLTIEVSPDGASWSGVSEAFSGSGGTRPQVMAEVPNGWWYRYTRTTGASIAWVIEWRRVAP